MPARPSLAKLLYRGLRKHCPRCGAGRLFDGWATMRARCPGCSLRFERESGGWLGAVVINMGVTQFLVVLYVVVALILTIPDVPTVPLIASGGILLIAFTIFFQPFSKTLWIGIDLWMRSAKEDVEDVDRA